MDAVEYFETKKRMVKGGEKHDNCNIACPECPLHSGNNGYNMICRRLELQHPERAVEIVQKWRNEHTGKTLKDKMLEILPNVRLNSHGVPDLCPTSLGLLSYGVCQTTNCTDCWNLPYKEV